MKKKLISYLIMISMILTPGFAFAASVDSSYSDDEEYLYPVPSGSYQTQGYGYDDYYGGYEYTPAANQNYVPETPKPNASGQYQGRVIFVPAQTKFAVTTTSTISSETAKVGDSVVMYLPSDFYYNNELIAPSGSRVNGSVIKVGRGTYASKNGKIQIRFTNIATPSGKLIPITASIATEDGKGILKAGTVKDSGAEYAKNALVGAATGAVLGLISSAIYGGGIGRGTIAGTAAGGAMGVVGTMFEKGDNVEIPQNAQLEIILDQPLTMNPNNSY